VSLASLTTTPRSSKAWLLQAHLREVGS